MELYMVIIIIINLKLKMGMENEKNLMKKVNYYLKGNI